MNIALILAGGSGTRMGINIPKQLLLLEGKPIVFHSLEAFNSHPLIDAIFVVCSSELVSTFQSFIVDFTKLKGIVIGGATRKSSCFNGLLEIKKHFEDDDIVLIHDAARPLISETIITNNIIAVKQFNACTTVIPVTDTILHSSDGKQIDSVLDRNCLYQAQTPQSFRLSLILSAHEGSSDDITDDTSLILAKNIPVEYVLGNKKNMKLTTIDDINMLTAFITKPPQKSD